jgi:hypothetical protein
MHLNWGNVPLNPPYLLGDKTMILIDFLKQCKELVDENPDALKMEMFAIHGASGAVDEMGGVYTKKVSEFDSASDECVIEYLLPSDYLLDSVIWVYIGN